MDLKCARFRSARPHSTSRCGLVELKHFVPRTDILGIVTILKPRFSHDDFAAISGCIHLSLSHTPTHFLDHDFFFFGLPHNHGFHISAPFETKMA